MTLDRDQIRREAEATLRKHRSGNFPLNGMELARHCLALLAELEQTEQHRDKARELLAGGLQVEVDRYSDEVVTAVNDLRTRLAQAEAKLTKVPALVEALNQISNEHFGHEARQKAREALAALEDE
jgi:predicted translin family RNA/ssDNA-binding protein